MSVGGCVSEAGHGGPESGDGFDESGGVFAEEDGGVGLFAVEERVVFEFRVGGELGIERAAGPGLGSHGLWELRVGGWG
ncbi:MAG: hypothetical protein RI897_3300 [Verrucomicrobiota bacterium]